jgi:flavodoxin
VNVLIVADSAYGNTWSVAEAISGAFDGGARVLRPEQAGPPDLSGIELLIVGSPTQGGRPLAAVQGFLKGLPREALKGVRVAAFDTRIDAAKSGFFLRLLMGTIGYAAPRIGKALEAHGGHSVAAPEGFIVEDKEGPLRAGELERAAEWARRLQTAAVG